MKPPTLAELDQIVLCAQRRNRIERLTGVLIYDHGCYFQWLEGPKLGLMRVWDSIRADPRHSDFKILRRETIPKRLFEGWDMRLARRTRGEIDRVLAVMEAPDQLLAKLRVHPSTLGGSAWDSVFADAVLPELRPVHAHPGGSDRPETSSPIWHAQRHAALEFAAALQAATQDATVRYIDALIAQGAGFKPLCLEVFEPAARCLGALWEHDRCSEFDVALALGRLQLQVRRVSCMLPPDELTGAAGHAVLVAPQPGELHGLSATLASTLFARDGWDVSTEVPSNDTMLGEMLRVQWFDVLELSLSAALRRERQLPALRLTIGAARAASLNPALTVIVDGRCFFERENAYVDVGADVGCATATDAVPAANRLLQRHVFAPLAGAEPQGTPAPGAAAPLTAGRDLGH